VLHCVCEIKYIYSCSTVDMISTNTARSARGPSAIDEVFVHIEFRYSSSRFFSHFGVIVDYIMRQI